MKQIILMLLVMAICATAYAKPVTEASHQDNPTPAEYVNVLRAHPMATPHTATIPHPNIVGDTLQVRFLAPPGKPWIYSRPLHRETVYDYGVYKVRIKGTRDGRIIVNYDGPTRAAYQHGLLFPKILRPLDW